MCKGIQSGKMDQFMWSCTNCRATFPSMENTTSALIDLRKCNDDQVGELENKTEEGKCQDIQITVSTMKDNLINCLKEDVEK